MGGRVPKEVSRERERRAWELRQKCWTQERIAAELGISQQAACQILKRVSLRVIGNLDADVEAVKREQTAQLWQMADESLQAWERSKEARKRATERTDGDGGNVITKEVADQDGDPRYLAEARATLADIRKIWGADAPEKKDVTSGGKPIEIILKGNITPDDV